jgi:hypothetical protein
MKINALIISSALVIGLFVTGCSTAVAVADTAASAAIYAEKTAVNVLDAITPDIVNKE